MTVLTALKALMCVWMTSTTLMAFAFAWDQTRSYRVKRRITALTATVGADQPAWVTDLYAYLSGVRDLEASFELPAKDHA